MKTKDLISAVAIGVLVAKVCCDKKPCPCPPPEPKLPPCKCVYKRYCGCNGKPW